jgi:hypothetical protein
MTMRVTGADDNPPPGARTNLDATRRDTRSRVNCAGATALWLSKSISRA